MRKEPIKMENKSPRKEISVPCNCKTYVKRLEKLQKKYTTLRKNHKKLLGVTILLTDALEQFLKGEAKNEINETLLSCSEIYPDLFQQIKSMTGEKSDGVHIVDENGKVYDAATESEKEYYEGFLARPKIPRTPQV